MLDKQNVIVEGIESPSGNKDLINKVAHEIYVKMVDYLRLTQSKNTYNRFSDYHYLKSTGLVTITTSTYLFQTRPNLFETLITFTL